MSHAHESISVRTDVPPIFTPAPTWPTHHGYDAPGGGLVPPTLVARAPEGAIESLGNRRRTSDRWGGLQARIALDRQTRTDAYRLRHLCYASKGYIDARDTGLFSDEYDAEPDNTTIVVYEHGEPIGSVRVCTMVGQTRPDTVRELPVAHVFPSDMTTLLAAGGSAVEINRLVSHPDHAHSLGLVFILIRMSDYLIRKYNPDFVTSCVRTNHVPFYKRLQFEQVAGPRLYTGLKFMTTFMVLQQKRYGLVRRTVPVLNLSPEVAATYETMWDGQQVAVFGDE